MTLSDKEKIHENKDELGERYYSTLVKIVDDIQHVIEFMLEYDIPVDKIVEYLKHTKVTEERVSYIEERCGRM